ncbi:MAG: EAL domain-containing protein [Erythrobacter sp.]|nr:EAL domain-containing protein [Erythrobacter sp.]NCQ64632.1 EAL domain-containing protein [Alphaproteobacteria bacterium]
MDYADVACRIHDEDNRLDSLAALAVLDTPVEAEFNELTQLAASVLQTRSAAVSLVDHDRQWFKSRVNLPFSETPRDIAFCHYTVERRETMVINDALLDDRFRDNKLVTAKDGIRFYAGAPLLLDNGHCVGSLCIIDPHPRPDFDDKSLAMLEGLANLAANLLSARRNRLRGEIAAKVVRSTTDAIVAVDRSGHIVLLNRAAEDLFCYSAEEALRQPMTLLLPDSVVAEIEAGQADTVLEVSVKTRNGHEIETEASIAPWGDGGRDGGFAVILRDTTERRALEADRNQARNLLDAIVANLPAALFVKDLATKKYVLTNQKASDIIGLPASEIIGLRDRDLFGAVGEGFEERDNQAAKTDQPFRYESRFVRDDGEAFDVRTTRIVMDGPDRPRQYILGVGEDMTDFRRTEAEKKWLLKYDELTGVLNRASMAKRLASLVEDDVPFAMLCINLDRFKAVNEQFGQDAGDDVLREVATRLQMLCDDNCIVGRVGGDEFVILMQGEKLDVRAVELAEKVVRIGRHPAPATGIVSQTGASVGLAFHPLDGATPEALRDNVDLALHRSKKEGGGRTCLFDALLDAEVRDRRLLESDLRAAIDRDEIVLHYQPVISCRTGKVNSLEALARWNHATRGPVSPEVFVALAEDCGLIERLGSDLLNRACDDLLTLPGNLRFAVNLSPQQFKSGELPSIVRAALRRTGLAPDRLQLEVTERLVIENAEETFVQLEELRGLGIQILMDDFGVGHSSLSYFQKFPFDKVKIDKSFIAGVETSKSSRAIVEAVVGLGRQLSMGIVAEGVECEKQRLLLSSLGCTHLQGYHFSPAMPLAEVAGFVAQLEDTTAPDMPKVA